MLLSLRDIDVYYGKAEAVKGLSVDVEEGSKVGIIGANGAGKSTILKAISGCVDIQNGEIYFMGKRIDKLPTHQLVKLGIVHIPEGRCLFPFMSVMDNLQLGAYSRNDKVGVKNDLEKVFELFPRLKERRRQLALTLSGGEQQMLTIGRGLMSKPKLLLLDEPSIGLAPLLIAELTNIINDISKTGITILLVEQNAGMVTHIANKCYVLEVGKVVLSGTMKELMANEAVKKAFLGG